MSQPYPPKEKLATSSVEEGLDFACNLISPAISAEGESRPEKAQQLLREFSRYVQFRYVGELLLALENLAGLGHLCDRNLFRSQQFWSQLRWVANKMQLSTEEKEKLEFPSE